MDAYFMAVGWSERLGSGLKGEAMPPARGARGRPAREAAPKLYRLSGGPHGRTRVRGRVSHSGLTVRPEYL